MSNEDERDRVEEQFNVWSQGEEGADVSRETSALREAIEAVIDRWAEADRVGIGQRHGGMDPLGADRAGFLADLVHAVEAVPTKVTIRDLDMAPENIVSVTDGEDVIYLDSMLGMAAQGGYEVHLTVDGGDLKVKVGGGQWSAPIQTQVYEP